MADNFGGRRGTHKNMRTKQRNAQRKAENIARDAKRKRLTPQQQIEMLDFRLGKGVGAVKERAKLSERLAAC